MLTLPGGINVQGQADLVRRCFFDTFAAQPCPPKKTPAQLGRVEGEGITFFAHIQYRDEQDKRKVHIRGPTRNSRRRAERDLLSIRKASEGHSVWADAIAAMDAKNRLGRRRHWPSPRLNESRPDRAEGGLYVQGSKPRRAEGALYVQSTCLDVQRILCTVQLSRISIY